MSSLWQDICYAFRSFGKHKGFVAIAVLTLAAGIGLNVAVFTITNAWLFKGLPFDKSDRIVFLGSKDVNRGNDIAGLVSYPDMRDWRAQAKSFAGIAAATGSTVAFNDTTGLPENRRGARVTANAFQVIGQRVILGRDFTHEDEVAGAPPVAITALRLSKVDINSTLKEGGRGSSASAHSRRLSSVLVVGEIALAIVLLSGAGLMIRSFLNIVNASLGVNTSQVLAFILTLPQARYKPADEVTFHDRLHERLIALPGVDSVATTSNLPTFGSISYPYELEGQETDDAHRPSLSALQISPDYFRVMEVGILQGRAFTDQDGRSGPPVAIVNQQFASKSWPGQSAINKRLRLFGSQAGVTIGSTPNDWLTVVGVVPNIVQNEPSPSEIDALIYLPFRQSPGPQAWVMARTHVPPGTLVTPVRKELQALDSGLPVQLLAPMQETLARDSWFYRLIGSMFAIFAGVALLLAAVGLYALMAHSVGQRTQEIGVRMAMGADSANIRGLVFRQGMTQLAIGLVIGLTVALALTRVLRATLVQVSPADPATFVIAAAILGCAAVVGCWLPARRAMKVDPIVALRYE